MNSEMATNSQLSTTIPQKNKPPQKELSKQLEQEQVHRNGDHCRNISGEGEEGERGKRYRE